MCCEELEKREGERARKSLDRDLFASLVRMSLFRYHVCCSLRNRIQVSRKLRFVNLLRKGNLILWLKACAVQLALAWRQTLMKATPMNGCSTATKRIVEQSLNKRQSYLVQAKVSGLFFAFYCSTFSTNFNTNYFFPQQNLLWAEL